MKILLIETEPTGHHVSLYLNALVDKFLLKGFKITILTSFKSKNFPTFNNLKKKNVKIVYLKNYIKLNPKNYLSIMINQIKLYFLIKNKFKKINKFDHIYLNTFTVIDKAISIFGSPFKDTKFSGLFPTLKFNYKEKFFSFAKLKNILNKIFFNRILKLKGLHKVFIPDPIFIKYSKNNILNYNKIYLSYDFGFFPKKKQFSSNKQIINDKLLSIFKNKNNYVILAYGSIRYEKGIQFLLRAVKDFSFQKNLKIIIAGKQDNYTYNLINNYKKDKTLKDILISLNYFISDEIENYLFKKTDIVWTGYTRNYHGSSAVFFLSSKYKKPVITSNHGLINEYNKKYKIGFRVEINDIKKIQKLLIKILSSTKQIKIKNFDNLNNTHNADRFSKNIFKNLINN